MSGHLVGSTAFKAAGTGDPRPAGSIPVHLREIEPCRRGGLPACRVRPCYAAYSTGSAYRSRCSARFASEEASPIAWSSAEMPSGTSSAVTTTRVPSSIAPHFPGHRHRAGERGVVGDEVDGLDDSDVGNDVDVSSLDDVGVSCGLPRSARSIVVRQHQSVRASGSADRSVRTSPSSPPEGARSPACRGRRGRRRPVRPERRSPERRCPFCPRQQCYEPRRRIRVASCRADQALDEVLAVSPDERLSNMIRAVSLVAHVIEPRRGDRVATTRTLST